MTIKTPKPLILSTKPAAVSNQHIIKELFTKLDLCTPLQAKGVDQVLLTEYTEKHLAAQMLLNLCNSKWYSKGENTAQFSE